jgi:PAS domain S-box-containing protein
MVMLLQKRVIEGARVALILILIVTACSGVFLTRNQPGQWTELYAYLFIIPILIASFYYGRIVGLSVALISSLVTGSLAIGTPNLLESPLIERLLFQIIIFNTVAIVTTELAGRERELKDRYQNLFEGSPFGLYRTTPSGIILDVNPAVTQMLDYPDRALLIGASTADVFLNPKDQEQLLASIERDGIVLGFETQFRRYNGTIIWVRGTVRTARDKDGFVQFYDGTLEDITERKRAEEALQESEEFNRSLVENLPDIIAIYDNKGIVRFANRAGLNILGSPLSKVVGKPILSFVTDDQRKDMEMKMSARLSGAQLTPYEIDIRTGSGEIIPVLLQGVPISYRKEPAVLLLMTNITERKQAEQRLVEAHHDLERKVAERTHELSEANLHLQDLDRLKSLFIASMSHELRTPLNSIIGFTGIMIKGMAGEINAEQKKQLGMVQDSARHLLALINDVIDISKIEAGKIEAGVSTFNLADVINDVRNTFGQAAQDLGLVLNMEIPGPIAVTSDERRIKQIIMNLVSNAIKFTDTGRVDVTVKQKGVVVEISVRDTGIGIGKEDLEGLFRPFVRVVVPGRLTEGTGLGLYLSRKIARFLGGDIMAESERDNGSVFTFTFPVTYEKQEGIW